MERGANTFPFHNLLPYSESNEGLFLFFSPSLNWIKEKLVATLAIRTFAIQKLQSQFTVLQGAVVISNPTSAQPQRDNAHSQNAPRRQFTKINMPLSQALQHMLKAELITLRDPPQNVNTSS